MLYLKHLSILLAIAAVGSAQTQTMAVPTGQSLRVRDTHGKVGKQRQIFVVPNVDHVFPYLLSSAAWTTTFYITNLEDHEISVACEYVGTDGSEKSLDFDFGASSGSGAFTTSKVSPYATESFRTTSTSATLTTAWTYCSADPRTDRFSGYAVVRNTTSTGAQREFVTLLQPESEPVFSVPFTDAANNTTGLVLLNSDLEKDSAIAIWVFDRSGKTLNTAQFTLKASNLRVIALNDSFKDVTNGTVRIVVGDGSKYVTGMALRTNSAGYSALPLLTPKEAPPAPDAGAATQ